MTDWNPETTPSFSVDEMKCRCGRCGGVVAMKQEFMDKLQVIRNKVGPLSISSGYRCPQHPKEMQKRNPGSHAQGTAADISMTSGTQKFQIIDAALEIGMVGIGLGKSFIHVDSGHKFAGRPAAWIY